MSERKRVFILEFSPVVASDGSTQTFLFSTQGFSTGAADTPSNTKVKPFLSNPGSLKRDLFSEARVTGAIKPNYGNVVLRNPVQTKGGSGELDAWVDYGLAGTRIKCYWGVPGDAYPGSWKLVYVAYCHSFLADVNELVFRLRDQLQLLDNPLAAEGFLGSGGLEGNGGISKPKQWVSGDPGFITPILVDYAKQIYLVQVNGCFNPDLYLTNPTPINNFDVFEGGVEIDRAQPNYSSAADILANSPAAGTVRYFFGPANPLMVGWFDGPVYFRLGSPPANDLRVYAQGVPTSKEMLAWGSAFGSYTADLLAVRAGVPRASVASGSAMLPVASVLVDDASSYLSTLSGAALAYQGFFGFTRLDTFKSGFLCSPEDDGYYYGVTSSSGLSGWPPAAVPTTSLRTFNTDQVKDFKREPVSGMEVPIWSVQVSAGKTQASKILAGASNEMKDYLSRDPYWLTVTGYSASTILANPGAAAAVVEIPGRVLQNSFATRMWLERYFVLYGGRRHFYTFSVPMTDALLDLELHDVVTLQGPRYGLSAGKKFRVVGITFDCSAAVPMVAFTCWGGDIGQYTGGGVPGVIWGGGGGGGGANTVENIARQALGDFTGQMIGSVVASSTSSTSGTDSVIAPFTGQLVGLVTNPPGFSWTSHGSALSWHGIASSSTGAKLVAVANGGQIYTSTDSGANWTARDSNRAWYSVASSSDGTKLVAVVFGGQIYTSTDSGANWTARDSNRGWIGVASSGDGAKLVAVVSGGQIYTSTDSGANWTARNSNRSWACVASSDDGVNLVAAVNASSSIYTSTDSGVNWSLNTVSGTHYWTSLASSSNGVKLLATADSDQLYTSTDSGANWTARDSSRSWWGGSSSADGTILLACDSGGKLYVSLDSGVNWTARDSNRSWFASAIASDASKMAAVEVGGLIYTSP